MGGSFRAVACMRRPSASHPTLTCPQDGSLSLAGSLSAPPAARDRIVLSGEYPPHPGPLIPTPYHIPHPNPIPHPPSQPHTTSLIPTSSRPHPNPIPHPSSQPHPTSHIPTPSHIPHPNPVPHPNPIPPPLSPQRPPLLPAHRRPPPPSPPLKSHLTHPILISNYTPGWLIRGLGQLLHVRSPRIRDELRLRIPIRLWIRVASGAHRQWRGR